MKFLRNAESKKFFYFSPSNPTHPKQKNTFYGFFPFNFAVVLRIEPRASSLSDPHPQSSALDFVLRQGVAKFTKLDLNLWFSYLSLPNSGIITLHF